MKDKNEIETIKKEKNQNQEMEVDIYADYDTGLLRPFWDDFFWERPFRKDLANLMRTDIEETENGYKFIVEVPGFERNDLNIGFESGYLTIAVNKTGNVKQNTNRYLRRERVVGASSRSFYVGDIDQTQITASLEKGILIVFVPKEIKSSRHQVEIK